ncbi:MAG: hypothetical protein JSW34_06600 [Candidatus Zixiibacteriota bacterium]|nr:MAG: hypothetical protein JSW34_06600 [candidate division Zixibacteria bacterium]
MKLRLIQKDIRDLDMVRHLSEASHRHPDLVCFGELAVSGCLYAGGQGYSVQEMTAVLSGYPFSIFVGFPCRRQGGLYNSYMYFKDGKYQIYDKINLFEPMNEPTVYLPGQTPGLFETDLGRLGVATCYDLRFPDLFRQLREGGAEKIFVPAAFPLARIGDWKELIAQRARETGVPVVGINAVGRDGTNEFGGCSMVAAPDGEILTEADESSELALEIDL